MIGKDIHILLDLDNTLISSVPIEEMDWSKKTKDKALQFTMHNLDDIYLVFERPRVQEFLDFLFENFKVSVWSAATKDYVAFVIDKVIQKDGREIEYVFYSYHCDLTKKNKFKHPKDLKMCWDLLDAPFEPNKTYIIDDLDKVFENQKDMCIPIHPFEFSEEGSENDDSLKKIREKLEEMIRDSPSPNEESKEDLDQDESLSEKSDEDTE